VAKRPTRRVTRTWTVAALLVFAVLCTSLGPPRRASVEVPFDVHLLIGDAAFRDGAAVSERDLTLFLEHTPYGRRSALADLRDREGRSPAQLLAAEARRSRVNPLVLLAKLQVEQSLVSRARASARAIDFALGCNCPDGGRCGALTRGFDRQVRCAAEKLDHYFEELAERGASRSLWRVSAPRRSACGSVVSPSNRATASLYTYTPYVLEGKGGNWLFHKIFRRYAYYLGYYPETAEGLDSNLP
jgi:hypothetical protein